MNRRTVCRLSACVLALVLAGAPLLGAQSDLGHIDFPTSGAAAAQPAFIKGVLLLHSFEYDDAREAFQQAQTIDPAFAMAYWGEAMTNNHPVWQRAYLEPARAALAKLGSTPEARQTKARTPKEKDWIASIEPLFGTGEKIARDLAYASALARMHAKYPDDLEVTSFYALALLGTSHGGRDLAIYMRAAALAEEVYAKNPQHPGAAHYLIHAYDDPIHAPLGLRYADAYGKVASAASHALHMPTHIYFALGQWDAAATMNERSVKAADDRMTAKKLSIEERGYHALVWLMYGYLQQGRYQDAGGVLAQLEDNTRQSGTARTRGSLAHARAAWLVETRQWRDAGAAVLATGLGKDPVTAELFALGLAAARSGNVAKAKDLRKQMSVVTGETPAGSGTHTEHQMAGAMPPSPAVASAGTTVPMLMAQQLDAVILFAEGKRDEAIVLAKKVAAAEDAMSFEFGPPVPVKPAHELVGDLLVEAGRAAEAQKAFETALKRAPGRALSLLGLFRAATAAGDKTAAQLAAEQLRQVWHRADKTLPELAEISKR